MISTFRLERFYLSSPVSLQDLDRFLLFRRQSEELDRRLRSPMELEALVMLAAEYGFSITEDDIFAAQKREQTRRSAEDLQKEQASESRRLRTFING